MLLNKLEFDDKYNADECYKFTIVFLLNEPNNTLEPKSEGTPISEKNDLSLYNLPVHRQVPVISLHFQT